MFDTAGSRLNFSVVAGVQESFRVSFYSGGNGMSVLGATFNAACYTAHGDEAGDLVAVLPVQHDSEPHKLLLSVPELAHGHYWWELRATDPAGKVSRLLYGTLASLNSAELAHLANAAEESALRELTVEIGAGYAAPLILRWQACSLASSLAADAARAAQRAEAAANNAILAQQNILDKLAAASAFMESFNTALQQAISVVDNYLWVGGFNTGHYLKGDPGITPHIGADGFWYEGSTRLGDRPAFGQDGITPHITPDGFWAFGDLVTTSRAVGRDGIDGSAVRYIICASTELLPPSGPTCNGGFRYCIPVGAERMARVSSVLAGETQDSGNYSGDLVFAARRTWNAEGGKLYRLGLQSAAQSNGEPSAEPLYAHLYYRDGSLWHYAGRSIEAVAQAVNTMSYWDFDALSLPPGRDVRVLFSQAAEQAAAEAAPETIRVKVVRADDGSSSGGSSWCAVADWVYLGYATSFYDIYAWLETPNGSGAWHLMSKSYDFASSEVYGIMKYATDIPIQHGAPVGRNAAGQASVPLADLAVPGAVMPSSSSTANSGGLTHMGTNGKLYVDLATPSSPGAGAASYSQTVENTASVGLTADGKWAVPPAAAFDWGCVRVGSSVPQSMGMPWIIPVGMASAGVLNEFGRDIRGQLMNNTLVGGALRTAMKETWLNWAPNGINIDLLPNASNAVGIMTSRSFSQNAAEGLRLEPATSSLLGGVTLCETLDSGSGMVPTVQAVLTYVHGYAYGKREVYTKQETYSRQEIEDRENSNNSALANLYKTKAEAAQEHKLLQQDIQARMRKSPSVESVQVLTLAEYQALPQRDKTCIYFVTEE